jgi:hypothetical protein
MECTSEYKPANNNAHLSDLGHSSLFHKIRLSCSLFWGLIVKKCDYLCKLPGATLNPSSFFVSSSVTVLSYTFSTTCMSCAIIAVRLAKPFEIEVKSSEENVYISGLNSGQWHSGDELIDIM